VTPLDVVRVRLQSQPAPQPRPLRADLQKLAASTPSVFRPASLGVTACCREVFFSNNSNETCVFEPKLSTAGGGGRAAAAAECAVEQTQQRTINSTLDGLRKIARNEGILTLWRGLSPTLVMAIPGNIIYFTGYEWLRFDRMSPIKKTVKDDYAPLVAGSVARVLAATAVSPIELFRTRLQASSGTSRQGPVAETFNGIREMIGLHGYRSLWRGLTLTLWRDVPFSGMYWWGYETIRGRLTDMREHRRGRPLEVDARQGRGQARRRSQSRGTHADLFTDSFIAGALSGAGASIATMPFDVGKTRTQVFRDSGKSTVEGAAKAAVAPEEQSMVRLLWHIYCNEGAAGLFKGWIPRTLKVAPACAIMISSYEIGKRVFRGVNESAARQQARLPVSK
jgi:solute carrier family 25, member 39/40